MMKKNVIAIVLAIIVLGACKAGGNGDAGNTKAEGSGQLFKVDTDTSYAFGMILGADLKPYGITLNYKEFVKGFQDALGGKELRFEQEDAYTKIQATLTEAMTNQTTKNQEKEDTFLAENGARPGIITTESGLQYEIITEGTGEKPGPDETVEIHYEGTLIDGTVFDSSYDRGEPAEFPLNGVIPGMSEGLQLMGVGGKYKLYIPAGLGYGDQSGGPIPPGSTLIFTVEVLSIVK
ncbi:peptidyl-prolyl cis-trans isomerase [Spirochaetia bacterium]|nr:peptidyl-prolyl cis-trans isomerase [Spirochaetia bacterium]